MQRQYQGTLHSVLDQEGMLEDVLSGLTQFGLNEDTTTVVLSKYNLYTNMEPMFELGETIAGERSIIIHEYFYNVNSSRRREVIGHETAHVFAWLIFEDLEHSQEWTDICSAIGVRTSELAHDKQFDEYLTEVAPHVYCCTSCGEKFHAKEHFEQQMIHEPCRGHKNGGKVAFYRSN